MSQKLKKKEFERQRRRRLSLMIGGCILAVVLLVVAIWSAINHQDKPTDKGDVSKPPQQVDTVVGAKFSQFSGAFVEDGSDAPVEHVAAMLVTNDTNEFLDLATFEYEIDGKEATFVVTGLPPGKSAWVMERNRLTIKDGADFKYINKTTAYKKEVVSSTDKITLSANGNMLTAVNNTNEKLEGVFVYYKTRHTDGNYLGGITYRTTFGDLEPGERKTELAGHFDKEKSEIVRIGWKEE